MRSYFAILPANIRYDKNLKPLAKLLYAEITALCNDKGYCIAPPNYFTEFCETTSDKVSLYINQLKDSGYIDIVYDNKSGDRRIYITDIPQSMRPIQALHESNHKFINEFLSYYTKLTGMAVADLNQIPYFKKRENQVELNNLYDNRKYNYRQSLKYAYDVAIKRDPDKRFFAFYEAFRVYINMGDGKGGIERVLSKEEQIEQENKKQQVLDVAKQEDKEREKKEQVEAEAQGLSLGDYRAKEEQEFNEYLEELKQQLGKRYEF